MIGRHKSSIVTFFGIYAAVSLIVGSAVYLLYRSHQSALEQEGKRGRAMMAANERILPSHPPRNSGVPESAGIPPEPPPESLPETPDPSKGSPPDRIQDAPPPGTDPPRSQEKADDAPRPDPKEVALEAEIAALYPFPEVKPLLEIVGNWKAVPKNAYPAFVTIHTPVEFEVKRGMAVAARGKLPAGSSMIPIQLQGDTLALSNSRISEIRVSLPVDETDFRERIEARYEAFVEQQTEAVRARRASEKKRRQAEAAYETAVSEYNDGSDPRFDPLKASIRKGEAGFFQIESAAKFRWGDPETIRGEEFETAYVLMVTESAFGSSERELKALIKDGKVVTWIDTPTGKEI